MKPSARSSAISRRIRCEEASAPARSGGYSLVNSTQRPSAGCGKPSRTAWAVNQFVRIFAGTREMRGE